MPTNKWVALQPASTSRVRTWGSAAQMLSACIQMLRTYWWWVPLLLLSMLAGSAVASHQKVKSPPEAKPTLLVEKRITRFYV
jgi:type II secretory pathway component PulF